MCIPHGAMGSKSNGFVKTKKPPKHVKRVSQELFEKGDPDFVDERTSKYKPEKKLSFLGKLINNL
jgi:hypothetical protein